jgi:acetylornithine deacetylase/succinyl-diaminopimelate desuccinylase-like protein
VVASLKRILGLDTVLLGFGLDDDRIHGPNEKFELVCYRRAVATHAALLGRLAELRIAAR